MIGYEIPEGVVKKELVEAAFKGSCKELDVANVWKAGFEIENGMLLDKGAGEEGPVRLDEWLKTNTPNTFVSLFFYSIGTSLQKLAEAAHKENNELKAIWILVQSKELYELATKWTHDPEVKKVIEEEQGIVKQYFKEEMKGRAPDG